MTDTAAEPHDPRSATRTREPLMAGTMSLVIPGLGQVYAGRPLRGLAVAVGSLAWGGAMLLLGLAVPLRAVRIATLLLIPAGRLFAVVDAGRVAHAAGDGYVLRRYNRWYVYAALMVAAWTVSLAFGALFLANVAHAWKIPAASMEPTLLRGDHVMASPRPPSPVRRGEVVVYGDAAGEVYVHRVVAIPGDVVGMRGGVLWLDGRPRPEPYAVRYGPRSTRPEEEMGWQLPYLVNRPAAGHAPTRDDWGPLRVPPGEYLLLGDNRDESYDGRWKGFVPAGRLKGRPVWIYFSRGQYGPVRWSRIGTSVR